MSDADEERFSPFWSYFLLCMGWVLVASVLVMIWMMGGFE
jgi:hypothetical protein